MIAYSDSAESEQVDTNFKSQLLSTEVGLKAEAKVLISALGFSIATELGYAGEREGGSSTEKSSVKARSRSFALGDPDDGDVFDVQVLRLLQNGSWLANIQTLCSLNRFTSIQTLTHMSSIR